MSISFDLFVFYLLAPLTVMFFLISIVWGLHFLIKNAALIDVFWSVSVLIYALIFHLYGGFDPREIFILCAVAIWCLRLTSHLYFDRIWKKPEEGRYIELRKKWTPHTGWKFFVFFQIQGVFNWLICVPFLISSFSHSESLTTLDYVGLAIVLVGILGEALSDQQLKDFKKERASALKSENSKMGRVCRRGLWNYSRHPNYFFEFVTWVGFAFLALSAPFGIFNILGFIGPALMLGTLYKVTGIPATEAQALRTKGDEYAKYQNEVSEFFPWPPKKV